MVRIIGVRAYVTKEGVIQENELRCEQKMLAYALPWVVSPHELTRMYEALLRKDKCLQWIILCWLWTELSFDGWMKMSCYWAMTSQKRILYTSLITKLSMSTLSMETSFDPLPIIIKDGRSSRQWQEHAVNHSRKVWRTDPKLHWQKCIKNLSLLVWRRKVPIQIAVN